MCARAYVCVCACARILFAFSFICFSRYTAVFSSSMCVRVFCVCACVLMYIPCISKSTHMNHFPSSIRLSICLSVRLSLSVCLSISVRPSVYLCSSVCLFAVHFNSVTCLNRRHAYPFEHSCFLLISRHVVCQLCRFPVIPLLCAHEYICKFEYFIL